MYSELEDTERTFYINILKKSPDYKGLLTYERCKAYLIKTSLIKISKTLSNFIQNTKYDKYSRILPIIVSSEVDKIQLFDIIQTKSQEGRLVYVPIPPEAVTIFYHIYSCLIEELGLDVLEEISKKIQTHKVRRTRFVNAFTNYFQDIKKKEQNILRFEKEIKVAENSLELIQLIGNFSNDVLLLFFDDIELPYEKYGEYAGRKWLESIKRLHYDVKQLIIILICSKDSWLKILNLSDESFSSILGPEIKFDDFAQLKVFITKTMEEYWLKSDINPPINPYFPLNEKLVNLFFEKTERDIRRFLKLYIEAIAKIISGELSL